MNCANDNIFNKINDLLFATRNIFYKKDYL